MRKWVLSGILASEETYLSHLEALLLVSNVAFRHLWICFTTLSLIKAVQRPLTVVLSSAQCRCLQKWKQADSLWPVFFIAAYEAPESSCHHLPACVKPTADRNHFLQSAWAPRDPQRLLWWTFTQGATVEPLSMCGRPLPEAGEQCVV